MSHRVYDFELPYTIPGVKISMGGLSMLKEMHLFDKLPAHLQAQLEAAGMFHNPVVTQHDLDTIDESTWTIIADKLGLKWHKVK